MAAAQSLVEAVVMVGAKVTGLVLVQVQVQVLEGVEAEVMVMVAEKQEREIVTMGQRWHGWPRKK